MKVSKVNNAINEALNLISNINLTDFAKREFNQKQINKVYNILYELKEEIKQEKIMKNIEKQQKK